MTKIFPISTRRFEKLFSSKKKALMPYVCFGYPTIKKSEKIIETLLKNGGNALEIGFPFSDPVADGPVLTLASRQALKQKIAMKNIFSTTRKLRKKKYAQPITLMAYYNLVLRQKKYILKNFERSGIDALLIPDVPFEEYEEIQDLLEQMPMSFIVGLNTPFSTIKKMAKLKPEFFYLMGKIGVTGAGKKINPKLNKKIREMKKTKVPIAVGFGISTKKQAKKINANGIIVGSHFTGIYNKKGLSGLKKAVKKLSIHY